jgi:hypothetical protein
MRIDPKTSKVFQDKYDFIGKDAPDWLLSWLRQFASSAINKYRRMRKGSPEQFTDEERIALAITFGKSEVEFTADFDGSRIMIELDKKIKVEVVDKKLSITVEQGEVVGNA